MLGVLFLIVVGLSFRINKRISSGFSIHYRLEGVMLVMMINLCFLVGNSACGVYSQLEEKVCKLTVNPLLI